MGTSADNPDTDGDGVLDGAEVRAGTDPLDGLPAAIGVLASVDTPGGAQDVCAAGEVVAVADGPGGVSLLDVTELFIPRIIAQVDTSGNATAVGCAGDLIAVADGTAGLCVIDAADPPAARILYSRSFGSTARAVAMTDFEAHVGLADGRVVTVDVPSNVVLRDVFVTIGGEAIDDLAVERDHLFVLAGASVYALPPTGPVPSRPSRVAVTDCGPDALAGRRRLFVGGGLAWVTCAAGFDVVDVSDPENMTVLGTVCPGRFRRFKHTVPTGSGPLLVADLGDDNRHQLWIYDPASPADTCTFLTQVNTPGDALAIAIQNGLAYVADGDAGVQVVNYLAFDTGGTPPSVELSPGFDPNGVEEGKRVWVQALVEDDVQVRHVEFWLNDELAATDGSFPFEYRFLTPRLTSGPTFTLKAVAYDTGGNASETETLVVTLTPDVTPPEILATFPDAFTSGVFGAGARFSEPIDDASFGPDSLLLWEAGPDRIHGTDDDQQVTGGEASFRAETQTLFLMFPEPLPRGRYRALLSGSIEDTAGLPLGEDLEWTFRVYSTPPPRFEEPTGPAMGLGSTTVPAGTSSATIALFVRHTEPIDAFAAVIEHDTLALEEAAPGDDLAPLESEFFLAESEVPGRTVIAASMELDQPPFVFPTLPPGEPEEAVKLSFSLPAESGTHLLKIARDGFGTPPVYPELTSRGRAVTPAEFAVGKITILGD